jgi:hypothetical protein
MDPDERPFMAQIVSKRTASRIDEALYWRESQWFVAHVEFQVADELIAGD